MRDGANPQEQEARALASERWAQRRTIAVTLVCWLILVVAGLWVAAHVIHALLILLAACLIAYALSPLVERLRRFMPRALALVLVYVLLLVAVGVFGYFVVSTAIAQLILLAGQVRTLLSTGPNGAPSPLVRWLEQWGITQAQITAARQQVVSALEVWTGQIVPVLSSVVNGVLDTVLVIVLSIYLLIDGARVSAWANSRAPLRIRPRVTSFLDTLRRVVGGYIRGQLALSALVGALVGAGMFVFHVPYAILLGVMAFVFEFIPFIGVLVSGAICVLLALTQGWLVALLVLIYFVLVQVIEGDVVGPRIVGHAIGLHPVVSIVALIAGAELFGIWGALLAAPLAGLAQAVLADVWAEWRKGHPDEFRAPEEAANQIGAGAAAADTLAQSALHPDADNPAEQPPS
jgi:predicted PurR-regulated permease PerM